MKDIGIASPVFVNLVAGRGCMNGVVNLTLATYQFTPNEKEGGIDSDAVVSVRLRMDIPCAMQLRSELDSLLESIGSNVSTEHEIPEQFPEPNGKVN